MAEEVGMAVAPMIIEPLMKKVIRHVLYAFNYNRLLEELKQETGELKMTQESVEHQVETSKPNEIEKNVAKWQIDVGKTTAEVRRLEEDVAEKKSCFNGLCPNFLGRYRLGKQAKKKKEIVTKLREKGNFTRVSYFPSHNLPGIEFYEAKDFMPSESARSALKLIMKILEDDKKKMLALYGMGGVGKTTLAVEVGKKAKELKLVNKVIIAVVSQCPSIEGIQGQIADMIGLRFEESSNVGKANRLRLRLEESKEKILIVLDDLWEKLDMAAIGIPCTDNCKVLLTTRQLRVCCAMGSVCDIPIDVLTDEEAWALFSRCGGLTGNEPFSVAKLVAKECKGLPLAILAVANSLKGKPDDQWKVALEQLKGSRYLGTVDADPDVYKCIRFSYDYLQNEEAKQCFMLCSLFPEDHNIEVEQLVRYAYGLELFRNAVDSIEEVRTEVHAVITSLKASSLLLSGSDENWGQGAKEFVKMHDIVRDVALLISAEEGSSVSRLKAGMGLEEWPKGISQYQSVRRISLMKNNIAAHHSGLVFPKLNLLLLDDNGCYKFPNNFFDGMKELQVLSIRGRNRYEYDGISRPFSLPYSVQQLTNLHTLRMEGLKLVDISVVGKLKSLEILSLRGSRLKKLPDSIGELNDLRLLDLSECILRRGMPANLLKKLSRLEELHILILGTDKESSNAILSDLTSLSRLRVLSLETDNNSCLGPNICFPKHLARFYISLGRCERRLPPKSKALVLKKIGVAKLNAVKEIIAGVDSLQLFDIEDDDCIPNIMPAIVQSGLDELTYLVVSDSQSMECLLDTTNCTPTPTTAFSRLDSLCLCRMNSFTEFICGLPPSGFFKELQELNVQKCDKLCTIVPAKLSRRLPNLKEMTIQNCEEVTEVFEVDLAQENEGLISNVERLWLLGLPELTRIWKGPTIGVVSLGKLREIQVVGCPKLTSLLSVSHAPSLVQLQSLRVCDCNELKYIFSADEGGQEIQSIVHEPTVLFPQLKVLQLQKLPNLIGLWHENHILSLPSLEELHVGGCPHMGTQFVADLQIFERKLQALDVEGISFPKLSITDFQGLQPVIPVCFNGRELSISNCDGIEELLQVGLGGVVNANAPPLQVQISWSTLRLENIADITCIWRGPSQILIFHNLQVLHVIGCHGLKNHLLTTSVARSLLLLFSLSVENCKGLEHVFADDETGHLDEKTPVVELPKLHTLHLVQLPNLISFCPPGYYFKFTLRKLCVNNCPNNRTGFFGGINVEATGRIMVHAKGEALCSSPNRGKCNDISMDCLLTTMHEHSMENLGNLN